MLLTDPLTALDLRGPDGRPSHAKLASVFVGGIFLYLILREPGWPPWGQLVTFVAGLYGFRMFSLFLHRWRGSSTSATGSARSVSREYEREVERVTEGPEDAREAE
jgi:hypothetical protein